MKLAELLIEKVVQVGDKLPSRGKPEQKARAFDKPGEHDRSALKKRKGQYHAIEMTDEGDSIQVLVMRDDIDHGEYHGINVIFRPDHTVDFVAADHISREQLDADEGEIRRAAERGLDDPDTPGIYDGLGGKSHKRGKGKLSFDIKKK